MIHVTQDVIGRVTNPLTNETAFIFRFTLVNDETGMHVQVMSYGAAVYSISVKNALGERNEVTLGYDSIEEYENPQNPYFGATIGRVCNRINKGKFNIYDKEVQLTQNAGKHHLHGGFIGFNSIPWGIKEIHKDGVSFCHLSAHNSEGYPGELFATVRYTLSTDNSLNVHITALTKMTTVVNITNHMYFNLAGHNAGSEALYEHNVTIYANDITETDEESIPTGEILPVSCTTYDFRTERNLGDAMKHLYPGISGFDDNFIIHRFNLTNKDVIPVAKVIYPKTGLWMEVSSNQPGLQFYTANYFPDRDRGMLPIMGKARASYFKHAAFCLETQKFPDAPNHPNFPSIILRPGELYEHMISYKFGTTRPVLPTPVDPDAASGAEW